jgi:hypothetical protein
MNDISPILTFWYGVVLTLLLIIAFIISILYDPDPPYTG